MRHFRGKEKVAEGWRPMSERINIMNDWRYAGQDKGHLNAVWSWGNWRSDNPNNDHDHCEYCWAKFSARGGDDLIQGWHDEGCQRWICDNCFQVFATHFQYKTAEQGAQPDAFGAG